MSAYTSTVIIEAPPKRVFEFVADPENQPRWAINFVRSTRAVGDGRYIMETPVGELEYSLDKDAERGVVDWVFPTPDGATILPARVVPHARGCVFTFTITRMPGQSDADWQRGIRGMDEELEHLKRLLEA